MVSAATLKRRSKRRKTMFELEAENAKLKWVKEFSSKTKK